jgi:D-lactate dehydrogenase
MKIRIFEAEPWECPGFSALQREQDLTCITGALTAENASEFADVDIVSTFIYSELSQSVLEQLGALKMIATRSTGYDHIDVDYCQERGIVISNVPQYGQNTVAEHVFGLLLTISHNLYQAIDRTRRGDFSSKGLEGFDLYGKTMGVIGTGHIGLHVIHIARGFSMRVIAYDMKPNAEAAERIGFEYVDMDRLLGESDVVTLHVPGSAKTRGLISFEAFEKMKQGAVLINTARGEVVDMQALIRALAEGKLAAAGLDVLPEEPVIREEAELLRSVYQHTHNLESLLANSVVLRLRNVVVTPHSAFNTREAVQRIIKVTAENIAAFIADRPQNMAPATTGGHE